MGVCFAKQTRNDGVSVVTLDHPFLFVFSETTVGK